MRRHVEMADRSYEVTVLGADGGYRVQVDGALPVGASLEQIESGVYRVRLGDRVETVEMAARGDTTFIRAFGRAFVLEITDPVEQAARAGGGRNTACAPMPGMVVAIAVAEGEDVSLGQPLVTIESMKMLTLIKAPRDGRVARVHVAEGQSFDKNAVLVTLTPQEDR